METSLLLPREKYSEVSKKYGKAPFTLEIQNENQKLFYFGANHSHDPEDQQYPKLREYWARFLKETEGKERIVLVEGGLRPLEIDEAKAIKRGSEGSFMTLLAHRENIPIASPDISDKELIKLLPNIPRQEILLYWFLSFVDHFKRRPDQDFEKAVERWCSQEKIRGTFGGLGLSIDKLRGIYQKVIGKSFDLNDNFNHMVNPNRMDTNVNQVARAQSDLRDANIASEIERYWNEGKSIFVVFGNGHLIIEEPALRQLLK